MRRSRSTRALLAAGCLAGPVLLLAGCVAGSGSAAASASASSPVLPLASPSPANPNIAAMLLSFAEKNPGMTRVLIGDALVNEDGRLQARINQLHDRLEATFKQSLRLAATQGEIDKDADAAAQANLMLAYIIGRWHQYAKSGFKRLPTELWPKQAPLLLG